MIIHLDTAIKSSTGEPAQLPSHPRLQLTRTDSPSSCYVHARSPPATLVYTPAAPTTTSSAPTELTTFVCTPTAPLALAFRRLGRLPCDSFGIEINNKVSKTPARILPPPKLSYRNKPVTAMNGAWNIVDTLKFLRGAKVTSYWGLCVTDDSGLQARCRPL
ncbi:hypothetical protein F5887DRAFT_1018338 [Amanita rubescens]|nr:hypothetical protein F5887DRAFT_1018338 [Amanita rubescens]